MVFLSRVLQSFKPPNPKALYKHLLGQCRLLPSPQDKFYKSSVRKEFEQHWDEEDEERVGQIMERAVMDAEWVMAKYIKKA